VTGRVTQSIGPRIQHADCSILKCGIAAPKDAFSRIPKTYQPDAQTRRLIGRVVPLE